VRHDVPAESGGEVVEHRLRQHAAGSVVGAQDQDVDGHDVEWTQKPWLEDQQAVRRRVTGVGQARPWQQWSVR
jgi:hypothetical protein